MRRSACMKMMKWLSRLFGNKVEIPTNKLTINDLDVLSDVWIKDSDGIVKGWVFEKTKSNLYIVYATMNDAGDLKVPIKRPFTRTSIDFGDKTIYFNKEDAI